MEQDLLGGWREAVDSSINLEKTDEIWESQTGSVSGGNGGVSIHGIYEVQNTKVWRMKCEWKDGGGYGGSDTSLVVGESSSARSLSRSCHSVTLLLLRHVPVIPSRSCRSVTFRSSLCHVPFVALSRSVRRSVTFQRPREQPSEKRDPVRVPSRGRGRPHEEENDHEDDKWTTP
ncbi:hypothetical protein Pcinc_042102 [Petrolisthes cinctipes]|uniref:Uncharacterized protein n=1 Tax=Petrolisthes cinctipes TaxID=88211 RepID=A0AAE1BJF6_PETCI|nr:hypothetical protein Pcinc_042102 [Petrolisthes cinctipes]